MRFADSFLFLQQEGHLIRTSLAQGLTALRTANLPEKGEYYAAFFGLSIGLERLMKVILIVDHMARNSLTPPTNSALRKYGGRSGHDLTALFAAVQGIPASSHPHPLSVLQPLSLEYEILMHLSEFGEACGRYANLDALSTTRPQADPLAQWKAITAKILEADVPARSKETARRKATALATALTGSAIVTAHDLDRKPLSLQQWFEIPKMQELAAGRAVVRVLRILSPLTDLLTEVNERAIREANRLSPREPAVPFMYEFLNFLSTDDHTALRKKRWP